MFYIHMTLTYEAVFYYRFLKKLTTTPGGGQPHQPICVPLPPFSNAVAWASQHAVAPGGSPPLSRYQEVVSGHFSLPGRGIVTRMLDDSLYALSWLLPSVLGRSPALPVSSPRRF